MKSKKTNLRDVSKESRGCFPQGPILFEGSRSRSARDDKEDLGEKCAVVAVYSSTHHAASFVRQALSSLQHRGQESTGVSIYRPTGKIVTHKGMGLVPYVLTDAVLKKLGKSKSAIGHNRYGTSGKSSIENAQPLNERLGKYALSLGHNGNIPDISYLRRKVSKDKKIKSDTALMAKLLIQGRPSFQTWEETFEAVLPEFAGAYCLTVLTNDGTLFGVRDPFGIRPLCLGKTHDGWVIASESVALDVIGAEFVRDVKPGEILKISPEGKLSSFFFGEPRKPQFCLFEYIYFARPDSFLNGKRVREGREESGRLLGERMKRKGITPDVVVPVFSSGYPAAKGVAEALKLSMVDAITTSHYIGRTFIQPGQENRVKAVNGKHNIIPDEIVGKNIVVVDDSAIRLTTSSVLARGLKEAGAAKVYMAFASPPVVNQCDMGIDMRNKKDLPASRFQKEPFEVIEQKVAELIGADGVIYLPIEETTRAMGGTPSDFYHYPFGGPHPLQQKTHFPKRKKKIIGKPKICIFISGSGTNLQEIINRIAHGELNVEIAAVLSNNKDAYGLTRAQKHNIPTILMEYEHKFHDSASRRVYEEILVKEIKKLNPDLILLSGWMMVLGDTFLKAMQELGIPVINHHPALLSKDADKVVQTSRGKVSVIRGAHGFRDSFAENFSVSGITVHQVLPGEIFDVGPIILKAEVRRRHEDTFESWEKRVRDVEYQLIPTAIKRILHVINHYNIDISKGDFPW